MRLVWAVFARTTLVERMTHRKLPLALLTKWLGEISVW